MDGFDDEPNVVVVGSAQRGTVMVFWSNLTAPFRANARPYMLAPVPIVMLSIAIRVPSKWVTEPRLAEPTCQYTPHAVAPPLSLICELLAVVSVPAILKMKTPAASPLSVSPAGPVNCADELYEYTPGPKVFPPRSWPDRSSVVVAEVASV